MRISGQVNNKCVYTYLDRLTIIKTYAYRRYLFSALCSLPIPGVEGVLFTKRCGLIAIILPVLFGRVKTRAGISESCCCEGCEFVSGRSWMDIILGFGLCLLLYLLKQ